MAKTSTARAPHLALALLIALAPALIGACSAEDGTPTRAASVEDVLARERAAAHFNDDDMAAAYNAMLALVEREDPDPADLIRMANIEFARFDFNAARPYVDQAATLIPKDPAVHWSLYRLARYDGDFEQSLAHVQRAHELAPGDYPTQLGLANNLAELDRVAQAEPHYQALLARGASFGGSWLTTTYYRYYRLLLPDKDRRDEAQGYLAEYNRLKEAGLSPPGPTELDRGTFGVVQPPGGGEVQLTEPDTWDGWMGAEAVAGELVPGPVIALSGIAGIAPYLRRPLGPGDEFRKNHPLIVRHESAPGGIVVWGQQGVHLATLERGAWALRNIFTEPVTVARPMNLAEDEQGDRALIVVATEAGIVALEETASGWEPWPRPVLAGFVPTDITPVDFDHDGDLDLLAVGPAGVRLLRNDGAGEENGAFVDATREAGLPLGTSFLWCTIEDIDVDQDIDLILGGGAGGLFHATNERGGRFSDATSRFPEEARQSATELVFHDFIPDGWPDFALPGASMPIFAGGWAERFTPHTGGSGPAHELAPDTIVVADPFGDGRVRIAWPAGDEGIMALDPRATSRAAYRLLAAGGRSPQWLATADLDGDGVLDWVDADASGLRASFAKGGGNTLRLIVRGLKDNRDGVGAVVEVRSGPLYRRVLVRGRPVTVGVGTRDKIDVVRVTWPNGVVQNELDLDVSATYSLTQKQGLIASCPFLYTWNGETYEFISDVLGITPLGLPMGAGLLVPPDHDEYVLVSGEQLVPKDGVYEIQFTEELREVTYLDRVRLEVIDHPEGTEIYPNERFTFPPFPEHHIHTVRDPLAPKRATGSDGRDWTAELSAIDDAFAVPFEPRGGQFIGLATPHFLELEFDVEALRSAPSLRLFMTGWFFWTDASVNMAAARHPTISFVPPILQVPDGEGGWRDAGPPIGFPAGKLKTMVIDVSELLSAENPRLRLRSTLRLYWDSIRLGVDADDTELVVTSIEPQSADLWERGFSEPISLHGEHALDWFEWDQVASEPRWNQHPGLYTRFGETLPLVTAIDDRFVIMGSGDALTVRFDASQAPPLQEGWTRDFLVFLDGWAKDRDPNSIEALYVEPLPFHGMSRYPYPADESFPNTREHRAWRQEWNTRHSRQWIESLVPVE